VTGELQSALRDCNEALRLRPNFVDALDSRGLVNLKSGWPRMPSPILTPPSGSIHG
jgi:hypothetical protein